MTAQIIDGKALAAEIRKQVTAEVSEMAASGQQLGLAVVLVGQDPASEVYVRSKAKLTAEVGMASFKHVLPEHASEAEILTLVDSLNRDPAVETMRRHWRRHERSVQRNLTRRAGCQLRGSLSEAGGRAMARTLPDTSFQPVGRPSHG